MSKIVTFAGGAIFGIILTCLSCAEAPVYSGPPGPPPGPPHPQIAQAIGDLQQARDTLVNYAANDYSGHKAAAIHYLDSALNELQICMSMP